jgi:N-acyl-D-amino-acid deacylase
MAALLGRLAAGSTRRRILDSGRAAEGEWHGPNGPIAWPEVMVAECPRVPGVEGRTMAEIAAARRVPPEAALIDLLLEAEGQVSMIHFLMLDANVARGLQVPPRQVRQPRPLRGTRGGPRRQAPPPPARVLREGPGHLRPGARRAELGGRGPQDDRPVGRAARARRPGALADVVVFDPETVDDLATYQAPHRYPAGIRWVWVNGGAVLEAGRFHARPTGRVLAPPR